MRLRPTREIGPVKKHTDESLVRLEEILRGMGSVLLAFSGGVDSALLLAIGHDALGERLIAVTASSPLYPLPTIERARELAGRLGVEHIVIETDELSDDAFTANPPDRCYLCKHELYGSLAEIAGSRGISHLIDGAQVDDLGDYRPGMRAAREFGVRSPLVEAGFTKTEVRAISRRLGLETWDVPAGPCLPSRIPYHRQITIEKLKAVEQGERLLTELGFREVRVRFTDESTARIEVPPSSFPELLEAGVRARVVCGMKELGFLYVSLDLEGFRSGSMNLALEQS